MSRQTSVGASTVGRKTMEIGTGTSPNSPSHPSQGGSTTRRTVDPRMRGTISFRVLERYSTFTDVSETEKTVGCLSTHSFDGKQVRVNTLTTAKFLCATIVGLDCTEQGSVTPNGCGNEEKNRVDGYDTVFSRSTVLSASRIPGSRFNSARNVRVLELPITQRLSVPFGDVASSESRSRSSASDTPCFVRRTFSDVVWGETVPSGIKQHRTSFKDNESKKTTRASAWSSKSSREKVSTPLGTSLHIMLNAGTPATPSTKSPLSYPNSFQCLRRQPVIPALDQMALDLRAGWMGEDDIEDELHDLPLFCPKDNTRLNRTGEQISNFLVGCSVMANDDIDYYCGIVPAGTNGVITGIQNWRMQVKWNLRNFERYPDCEVCGFEVSLDSQNLSRIKRKGTVVRLDVKEPSKVNFDLSAAVEIDPDTDTVEAFFEQHEPMPRSPGFFDN